MAHTCAGRVFCTHVFRQGFGRPHSRARVKEARPLFCLQKKMEIKDESYDFKKADRLIKVVDRGNMTIQQTEKAVPVV